MSEDESKTEDGPVDADHARALIDEVRRLKAELAKSEARFVRACGKFGEEMGRRQAAEMALAVREIRDLSSDG